MRSLTVVETDPRLQRRRSPARAGVRPSVRPFAQQRLNESFGFAIRPGRIGPRPDVPQTTPREDGGEGVREIAHAVVTHDPPDADPEVGKPLTRPLQKPGAVGAALRHAHLDVGQPRGIVDRDVGVFVADAALFRRQIAGDAMANALDPRQRLDIDVHQVTGRGPFIPADRWPGGRGRSMPRRRKMADTVDAGRPTARAMIQIRWPARRSSLMRVTAAAGVACGERCGREEASSSAGGPPRR